MSISATARSATDRPNRYAVPYSVRTQWTSARAMATGSRRPSSARIAGAPTGVRHARQMIGHAAGGQQGAAVEVRAGRDTAVELAVQTLGADLPREVDGEGLGDGNHSRLGGDDGRVADLVNRPQRVAGSLSS